MTPKEMRADDLDHRRWMEDAELLTGDIKVVSSSLERTRAVNEVGSAIAHQLTGPLTALLLYVGEIRRNSAKPGDTVEARNQMQQMVEAAFQETERVCAMMRAIADSFEEPLCQETAATLGREVITWWSRNGEPNGGDPEKAISIHELLTPRERQVLGHISQGCSNKQGAVRMQIGPRTFESHRFRIMRKLGAKNGADLVRMVLGENSVTQ
jgi:DNA-binding CsgD family transcriptional regulator